MTFHRSKRQFGQMDFNEAKRLMALEKENIELQKMLAIALLAKRVLECAVGEDYEPGTQAPDGIGRRSHGLCSGRTACRIFHLTPSTYHCPESVPSPRRQQSRSLSEARAVIEDYR